MLFNDYNRNAYDMDYGGVDFMEAVFNISASKKVESLFTYFDQIREALDKDYDFQSLLNPKRNIAQAAYTQGAFTFQPFILTHADLFKNMENEFNKIFGFRSTKFDFMYTAGLANVDYGTDGSDQGYDLGMVNGCTRAYQRYYIDGLVNDKDGFYDKTHSIAFDIEVAPQAFIILSNRELMAVILHEIGHNLDPAINDIEYKGKNDIVDYLGKKTDRYDAPKNALYSYSYGLFAKLKNAFKSITDKDYYYNKLKDAFSNQINRSGTMEYETSIEAFADNLARIYGYGADLVSGLNKMNQSMGKLGMYEIKPSPFRFIEQMRENAILLVLAHRADNDEVHRTTVARIHALINQYNADINNKKTKPAIRKILIEDRDRLQAMLNEMLNDPNEFKRRVTKIANDIIVDANANKPNENNSAAPSDGITPA